MIYYQLFLSIVKFKFIKAIERLNIKPGFWKDLLTDEPFVRKDLITIQNPNELDKFNLANFYHIRKNLKVLDEGSLCEIPVSEVIL